MFPGRGAASTVASAVGQVVDSGGVTFRYPDPEGHGTRVRLVQEVAWPRSGWWLTQRSSDRVWELHLPRPPVDRMEYQFELVHEDGRSELILDPGNPRTAPGAFGPKSVVEFPEYRPPSWTRPDRPSVPSGERRDLEISSTLLDGPMRALLWSPAGSRPIDELPLLIAHDGIEFAAFSQLLEMLDQLTGRRLLPRMRAALLQPVSRDQDYSASPRYARAVSQHVMPFLASEAPYPDDQRFRVGLGASLGALAMLHLQRTNPDLLGGLFLQSGSFFNERYDPHQLSSGHIRRVRRFIGRVHSERRWAHPVPLIITCGQVEMNLINNLALSRTLRRQGYSVDFRPMRDAHNWVAWRDAWHPALIQLLRRLGW
jgi:enterochelin esterase family protein